MGEGGRIRKKKEASEYKSSLNQGEREGKSHFKEMKICMITDLYSVS